MFHTSTFATGSAPAPAFYRDSLPGKVSRGRKIPRGRFESVNVSIKPYPSCKFTHAAIYGTLELMNEQKVRPGDVDEITVGLNHLVYQLTGAPEDKKRRPQQPIEAQFSIPYLIGTAVVNKDVLIEHVTDKHSLNNPDTLNMAERVKCSIDNDVEKEYLATGSMGARVTIRN